MAVDSGHAYGRIKDCRQTLVWFVDQEINLLMHSDNICLSAIHSLIILVGPIQPRLDKPLQTGHFHNHFLSRRHEHFKHKDSTAQDWGTLTRHHFLCFMRNLLKTLQSQNQDKFHTSICVSRSTQTQDLPLKPSLDSKVDTLQCHCFEEEQGSDQQPVKLIIKCTSKSTKVKPYRAHLMESVQHVVG